MAQQKLKKTKLKSLLNKICKSSLEASVVIAEKNSLKDLTDDDIDSLAEAIELLNDIYEELYDNVFEDSEIICQNKPDRLK